MTHPADKPRRPSLQDLRIGFGLITGLLVRTMYLFKLNATYRNIFADIDLDALTLVYHKNFAYALALFTRHNPSHTDQCIALKMYTGACKRNHAENMQVWGFTENSAPKVICELEKTIEDLTNVYLMNYIIGNLLNLYILFWEHAETLVSIAKSYERSGTVNNIGLHDPNLTLPCSLSALQRSLASKLGSGFESVSDSFEMALHSLITVAVDIAYQSCIEGVQITESSVSSAELKRYGRELEKIRRATIDQMISILVTDVICN